MATLYVSEDTLTRALEKVFEKVCQENPTLRPAQAETLKNLARETAQNLRQNTNGIFKETLKDPAFIKKLYLTATLTLTFEKDQNLKKLKDFFNTLKPEDQEFIRNMARMTPEQRKKMMPEFSKKFAMGQELMKRWMKDFCKNIGINLEKNKLTPKLGPKQSAKLEEDGFQNLFNLLSNQTGALPVVVQVFMGNGNAFPEFSPYQNSGNTSNINLQNRTDEPYGDYLGLNRSALNNLAGEGIVSSLSNEMTNILNTPTYTR